MTPERIKQIRGTHYPSTVYELCDEVDSLRSQLASAQRNTLCDVCCGTGDPNTGKPCICGGTGWLGTAVINYRLHIFDLEAQLLTERAKGRDEERERAAKIADHATCLYTSEFRVEIWDLCKGAIAHQIRAGEAGGGE